MAATRLRVTKLDGTHFDYKLTPAILVAFERQFKVGVGQASDKFEHLYWMAYEAERRDTVARGGVTTCDGFDQWLDTVESVEDPDREDPTKVPPSDS